MLQEVQDEESEHTLQFDEQAKNKQRHKNIKKRERIIHLVY